ncbi:Zinc knuckle [Geosmithia morbida]|uniref:Zinc knuckle n=1 Tax=Geosmithia morbida TaxID=1094350 RepID=A0A9P5CXG6_9HYPO|nr:Zinc knuckle [Geosmithia morbida]KAF4119253.1 Zinc knuckle [Geosmithia morbida]
MSTPTTPASSKGKQLARGQNPAPARDPVEQQPGKPAQHMDVDDDDDDDDANKETRREIQMLKEQIQYLSTELINMGGTQTRQAAAYEKRLEEMQNLSTTASTRKEMGEIVKPSPPGLFKGRPETLQPFLTQLRAYFMFFPRQFRTDNSKVMFAAGRLRGTALKWFEPTMRKYVNNPASPPDDVQEVMFDYGQFENSLLQVFGSADEEREAENQLKRLRQTGSMSEYATKFLQVTSKLPWESDHLMSAFYDGMKEEVKDEIYKMDRPYDLATYMSMAVKIDDRQYSRRRERNQGNKYYPKPFRRSNNQRSNNANQGKPRRQQSTAFGQHAGLMELDAMRDKSKETCHSCGKKGHYARECRQKKKDCKPV